MITVQIAEKRFFPQMTAIWCGVFGDSEAFVRAFYACDAMQTLALIAREGETVAGIVHMLPVTVQTPAGSRSAYYFYAGAVLPAYRGRGIFRQLCTLMTDICVREKAFGVMVPAEASLFPYYAAFGYQTVPFCSEAVFTPHQSCAQRADFSPLTPELYHRLRAQYPETAAARIEWSTGQLAFIIADQVQSGGFAYAVRIGGETAAVLGSRQGDALYLTELAAPAALRDAVLSALAANFRCERIIYRANPGAPDGTQRFGMMLPLSGFSPESVYFPIDLI